MEDNICHWDGCDQSQFEDWYYCQSHVKAIEMMNEAFRPFIR